MTQASDTDSMIQDLARQAGARKGPSVAAFGWILLGAVALAWALAVAFVLIVIGPRADFTDMVQRAPFQFKIASMAALAVGVFVLVRRAVLPGRGALSLLALLPAALLLAFRAATDESGLSMMGVADASAGNCIMTILAASVLAFAVILAVLRLGAPTRPGVAGALAGGLSGTLGAAAYALACLNDAGLFVAIWYPVGILAMAGLGAVIGRRWLVW